MEIAINYTDVIEKISRSLSIIGKRARDDKGKSLYEDITFGNNEYPLLKDFVRAAATKIITVMRGFVEKREDDESGITIHYGMPSAAFFAATNEKSLQQAAEDYILSYTLARWFSFVLPSQVEFYSSDASSNLSIITNLLYESRTTHVDLSVKSVNQ